MGKRSHGEVLTVSKPSEFAFHVCVWLFRIACAGSIAVAGYQWGRGEDVQPWVMILWICVAWLGFERGPMSQAEP